MEPNPLIQFNLRDLYRILFRHWRRSLAFLAVVLTVVVAAVLVAPRKYVSEAQLLVNVGLESLNADPTTNGTPSVSLQVAREEEMKSILDLFRSHAVAVEVVARLGASTILRPDASVIGSTDSASDSDARSASSSPSMLGKILGSVQVSEAEKAVRKLHKMVTVGSSPKSNVVRISAEAETPELAQQVVQAFVAVAREKHSNAHRTENSTSFLESKLQRVKDQLLTAGQELRDFKNTMGVSNIEGRKRTLDEQIRELQTNLINSQSELRSFQDKIAQLHQQGRDLPIAAEQDSGTSVSSQSLDTMRAELYTLRVRSQGLASRLTPSHPLYRGAVQQVEQAERDLEIEELRFATSNVARLQSKIRSYQDELQVKRGELRQLNLDEVELKSLQAETDLLEKRYERYNADLANARIIEDRRSHEITNINVFQPASKVETPVSPNRKLLVMLGGAVAMFGAFALAFASEFLDSTLKSPEDVESCLQLPVLESIPHHRQPPSA